MKYSKSLLHLCGTCSDVIGQIIEIVADPTENVTEPVETKLKAAFDALTDLREHVYYQTELENRNEREEKTRS